MGDLRWILREADGRKTKNRKKLLFDSDCRCCRWSRCTCMCACVWFNSFTCNVYPSIFWMRLHSDNRNDVFVPSVYHFINNWARLATLVCIETNIYITLAFAVAYSDHFLRFKSTHTCALVVQRIRLDEYTCTHCMRSHSYMVIAPRRRFPRTSWGICYVLCYIRNTHRDTWMGRDGTVVHNIRIIKANRRRQITGIGIRKCAVAPESSLHSVQYTIFNVCMRFFVDIHRPSSSSTSTHSPMYKTTGW